MKTLLKNGNPRGAGVPGGENSWGLWEGSYGRGSETGEKFDAVLCGHVQWGKELGKKGGGGGGCTLFLAVAYKKQKKGGAVQERKIKNQEKKLVFEKG